MAPTRRPPSCTKPVSFMVRVPRGCREEWSPLAVVGAVREVLDHRALWNRVDVGRSAVGPGDLVGDLARDLAVLHLEAVDEPHADAVALLEPEVRHLVAHD